jgi:hypothetical protein
MNFASISFAWLVITIQSEIRARVCAAPTIAGRICGTPPPRQTRHLGKCFIFVGLDNADVMQSRLSVGTVLVAVEFA